ncbi:CgeB family protein [Flavobacterium sp. RS13.1]|uniref:CgeB family protein n=1 Tax=Flavobacterium sp. RS13.1 TaxID=3400345 RepID=UPI003AAF05A1
MKITLFGSKDFDSLEYHLNDSFTFIGHTVNHIDIKDVIAIPYKYNYFATKFLKFYDEYLFKKVAKLIIDSEPELIVCTYRFIHPICIKLIKEALPAVQVVHVNPDALTTFEYQQIFASAYDAYFTKDRFIVDFMKNKMGLPTFYLPEAFNPRVHKMPSGDRKTYEKNINIDVVAFGTMYPYRANMMEKLLKTGIDLTLFGTPDRRFAKHDISSKFQNEYITGNRKAEVLYGAKIVFNNFHYAEVESANVKFFEIAGIGGFQICDYKTVLQEYSKINVEKFTYKSIGEAIDLVQYYLDKPNIRHELALEQYNHFLLNHTYEHRINQMLQFL